MDKVPGIIVFLVWAVLMSGVVGLMIWRSNRRERKQEARRLDHLCRISQVFEEIARRFKEQGLEFQVTLEYGRYAGQTVVGDSGGYIAFRHYLEDDWMISLDHVNLGDARATYDQQARAHIHHKLVHDLIYNNGSGEARFFCRHNLFNLEEEGIHKVVVSLIAVLKRYDAVWAKLKEAHLSSQLRDSLELAAKAHTRIMEDVGKTRAKVLQ